MSCQWSQRIVLNARIAKLVAFGEAPNILGADTTLLTLPSPRLQAQLSIIAPPANGNGNGANSPIWCDRSNATAIGGNCVPAVWQIYPLLVPGRDIAVPGSLDPNNLAGLTRGAPVLALDDPADEMRALRENHAIPGRQNDSYVISGEVNRLWLIYSAYSFISSPTVPVYAAVQAEITPVPDANMSAAEWAYLLGLCELRSLTNSPTSPPVISSASG